MIVCHVILIIHSCPHKLLWNDFGTWSTIQFVDDATSTSPFPEALVISVSSAVGVIVLFLLVGALLGYIVVVKKILSQIAANRKQTMDMEGVESSVLISNPYHE